MDVIKEDKLFEKYMPDNVEIEWTSIDSGSDRRDALATGRVVVAMLETTKAIPAIEKGYPIQYPSLGRSPFARIFQFDWTRFTRIRRRLQRSLILILITLARSEHAGFARQRRIASFSERPLTEKVAN